MFHNNTVFSVVTNEQSGIIIDQCQLSMGYRIWSVNMKCITSNISNVGPFLKFLKIAQTVTVALQLSHWMLAEFPLIC